MRKKCLGLIFLVALYLVGCEKHTPQEAVVDANEEGVLSEEDNANEADTKGEN